MSSVDRRISHLSEDQLSKIESFKEITNITDDYLCMQILIQNKWNLDNSLNQFVNEQNDDHHNDQEDDEDETRTLEDILRSSITDPLLRTEIIRNENTSMDRQNALRRYNNENRVDDNNSNNNYTSTSGSTQRNALSESSTIPTEGRGGGGGGGGGGLTGLLLVPLKWLFQSRPISLYPEQDSLRFIEEYNNKYSREHPNFHRHSYQNAVATAFQRSKFLFVYLHSPIHDDTQRFCQSVLSAPGLVTYTNENMLTWAGKIWDPEAYGLSSQLKVSTFPFMAVLICQSNRTVQVVERIQGYIEEAALLERLRSCTAAYTSVINRTRQESQRRDEATRLRAQQDREYQESQEADRLERERQKELQLKKVAEEEEKQQQEELAAAIAMSRQLSFQDRVRKLKAEFATNPEPSLNATGVTTIRFQLPTGTKLSRRFLKSDQIQVIKDYLNLHFADSAIERGEDINSSSCTMIKNFAISTHFPKVELIDMTQTVEAAGLHPRGMLFVQDLDA